jgi:hypothetical protein
MSQTFHTFANKLELSKDVVYHFVHPRFLENFFYLLRAGSDGIPDTTLINFIYKVDGNYKVKFSVYDKVEEINNIVNKEQKTYYIVLDNEYNLL